MRDKSVNKGECSAKGCPYFSGIWLFGLYRNQWKIILTLFWVAATFAYAP
jgi:hypothetical protein